MSEQKFRNKYVYGPVKSWRSGTSLGIDPIGDISTCSFNCVYCQLGRIQNITQEIKTYVPTEYILEDLMSMEREGAFSFAAYSSRGPKIDVITFAGSGEPTLAENLGEIIDSIRDLLESVYSSDIQKSAADFSKIPISILTNATMLGDKRVRARAAKADKLSLKLDAIDDATLKAINQPAPGITMQSIIDGIKLFQAEYPGKSELQIMLMPKQASDEAFITKLAGLIKELQVLKIQINTPTRPKPKGADYLIETRGNHYHDPSSPDSADIEYQELPVITKEEAFKLEDKIKSLVNVEVVNVYKRP